MDPGSHRYASELKVDSAQLCPLWSAGPPCGRVHRCQRSRLGEQKNEKRACSAPQELHSSGAAHLATSSPSLSPSKSPRIVPKKLGLLSTQTAGLQEFDQTPTPRLVLIFPECTDGCRSYDRYRLLILSRYHKVVAEGKGFSSPLTMECSTPSDLTNPAAMAEEKPSRPPHPRHPNIIRRRAASARPSLSGEVAAKPSAACGRRLSSAPTQREWGGRPCGPVAVLCRTAGEEAGRASLAVPRLASPMLGSSLY